MAAPLNKRRPASRREAGVSCADRTHHADQEKIATAKAAKTKNEPAKSGTQSRAKRLAGAFKAAGEHFRKAASRVKGKVEAFKQNRQGKRLPQSTGEQAGRHSVKQRKTGEGAPGKQQTKTQQKTAAPIIRKGR